MYSLGFLNKRWVKVFSFTLATPLALLLLLYPTGIMQKSSVVAHANFWEMLSPHTMIMFVIIGICICYVHGVGFVPSSLTARIVLFPMIGWLLAFLGYFLWISTSF